MLTLFAVFVGSWLAALFLVVGAIQVAKLAWQMM